MAKNGYGRGSFRARAGTGERYGVGPAETSAFLREDERSAYGTARAGKREQDVDMLSRLRDVASTRAIGALQSIGGKKKARHAASGLLKSEVSGTGEAFSGRAFTMQDPTDRRSRLRAAFGQLRAEGTGAGAQMALSAALAGKAPPGYRGGARPGTSMWKNQGRGASGKGNMTWEDKGGAGAKPSIMGMAGTYGGFSPEEAMGLVHPMLHASTIMGVHSGFSTGRWNRPSGRRSGMEYHRPMAGVRTAAMADPESAYLGIVKGDLHKMLKPGGYAGWERPTGSPASFLYQKYNPAGIRPGEGNWANMWQTSPGRQQGMAQNRNFDPAFTEARIRASGVGPDRFTRGYKFGGGPNTRGYTGMGRPSGFRGRAPGMESLRNY